MSATVELLVNFEYPALLQLAIGNSCTNILKVMFVNVILFI